MRSEFSTVEDVAAVLRTSKTMILNHRSQNPKKKTSNSYSAQDTTYINDSVYRSTQEHSWESSLEHTGIQSTRAIHISELHGSSWLYWSSIPGIECLGIQKQVRSDITTVLCFRLGIVLIITDLKDATNGDKHVIFMLQYRCATATVTKPLSKWYLSRWGRSAFTNNSLIQFTLLYMRPTVDRWYNYTILALQPLTAPTVSTVVCRKNLVDLQ